MPVLYVIRYGLRAVFGENFDALLDLVYKDHAEEINAYAAQYLRNPENNVDNQRYLTEEFLADCADAEVKPSWWKELIAKIRMWLRNYLPNLNFSNKDIEGVISMAHRRIRRSTDGYGNVRTGTDLADGLRFALDEDGLSVPVVLPEQQNSAGEILSWLEKAVDGDTDLDFYGNDLAEQFDSWAELDGSSRRELLEQSYEEEIRDAKSNDGLENDFALKDAYQDAFDSIEEKISEVLEENGLELDNSKVNASGNSFYLKFEAPDGEYYTLRFSDHKQPARGSYRQNEYFGGRSIADVDVVLSNGKFDIAPAVEFIQRVAGGDGTVNDGGERKVTDIFIEKVSDDYFQKPDKDIQLRTLPDIVLSKLNKPQKPLVLKKNIVEKNKIHADLSKNDILEILSEAIYNCDLIIQPNPKNKPNYFMLVSRGTKSKQALLEISENKEHYEIVNYHYLGERQLRQKIKRATDQNGFIESIDRDGLPDPIITQKGAAGRFSALPATTTIPQTSENANNFRFLLAEFSEAERRDITLILKPFVGFALDHEDRIYKEYLAKKGIAVSEKDAHAFAVTAMRENNSDRNKRTAQRREKNRLEYNCKRDQYLYDNFPFYREAVEFAGSHDFKIKPSGKFRGEEFSGSFIAPEFVKYSGEKAAKNSGKLDAAQGVNSNELAAKLARSWGRDHLASSFNPAIPTIMAKIQSIRRIEAVSLKNIIPQITAPTVPIPVQIAYAVPSGSVLVANARPMMLPVIAAITMIDGTSLVKPWLYFIATAQQTSNIPAKNKYNHAIKYLHKKTAAIPIIINQNCGKYYFYIS